jgi:hypothetical protein
MRMLLKPLLAAAAVLSIAAPAASALADPMMDGPAYHRVAVEGAVYRGDRPARFETAGWRHHYWRHHHRWYRHHHHDWR